MFTGTFDLLAMPFVALKCGNRDGLTSMRTKPCPDIATPNLNVSTIPTLSAILYYVKHRQSPNVPSEVTLAVSLLFLVFLILPRIWIALLGHH